MDLMTLVERQIPPVPWDEGEKIPWNDPDFSSRMLLEHLSQEHNAASRRSEIIDEHVTWIHLGPFDGKRSKILDLGCGPGLYTSRLARLRNSCVGIDFAPASISYARQVAAEEGLTCQYIEADLRKISFETGFDLVMMVHGELNVFRPEEIQRLIEKARRSLRAGGILLLEVHTLAAVKKLGTKRPRWSTAEQGLFADRPHLLLTEAFWHEDLLAATERYYVIDLASGDVIRHAATIQGYDDDGYRDLLKRNGFAKIESLPSLGGETGARDKNYAVYMARFAGEIA